MGGENGLNEQTDNLLDEKIPFPDWLNSVFNSLFRLGGGEITYFDFIVSFGMLVAFFILFLDVLEFTSFSDLTRVIIGIGLSVIVSVLGIVNVVAQFFYVLKDFPGKFAIVAVIIFVVLIALKFFMKYIRKRIMLKRAAEVGGGYSRARKNIEDFSEGINKAIE